jgi:hypothetical protein
MMGDRLLNTPSHTGENSSYSLQFRAPQFQCNTSTSLEQLDLTNEDDAYPTATGPAFRSSWDSDESIFRVEKYLMKYIYTTQHNGSRHIGAVDVQRLECRGVSALLDLRITHPKGIQEIYRNTTDLRPLRLAQNRIATGVSMPPAPYTNTSNYGEDVRNFTEMVARLVPTMNEKSLLDSFGRLADGDSNQTCYAHARNSIRRPPGGGECTEHGTLDNETAILLCEEWKCDDIHAGASITPGF